MHRAPAVSFSVGRSRWHLGCIVASSVLALAVSLGFVWNQSTLDWRSFVVLGLTLASSAAALHAWWRSPVGLLRWEGCNWHWSEFTGAQECHLSLLLDFQRAMLVVLRRDGQRDVWLWLQSRHDTATQWLPLRRSIICGDQQPADSVDALHDTGGSA